MSDDDFGDSGDEECVKPVLMTPAREDEPVLKGDVKQTACPRAKGGKEATPPAKAEEWDGFEIAAGGKLLNMPDSAVVRNHGVPVEMSEVSKEYPPDAAEIIVFEAIGKGLTPQCYWGVCFDSQPKRVLRLTRKVQTVVIKNMKADPKLKGSSLLTKYKEPKSFEALDPALQTWNSRPMPKAPKPPPSRKEKETKEEKLDASDDDDDDDAVPDRDVLPPGGGSDDDDDAHSTGAPADEEAKQHGQVKDEVKETPPVVKEKRPKGEAITKKREEVVTNGMDAPPPAKKPRNEAAAAVGGDPSSGLIVSLHGNYAGFSIRYNEEHKRLDIYKLAD